jgi:hypothetical protein
MFPECVGARAIAQALTVFRCNLLTVLKGTVLRVIAKKI